MDRCQKRIRSIIMWQVRFDKKAIKQLGKLDRDVQKRISDFIDNKLQISDDPKTLGKKLQGKTLGNFYRYSAGDYRMICNVKDEIVTVYVLKITHRGEIYRE